jgi:cytochrome c556
MKTTRNVLLGLTTAALTAGVVFAGSHTTPEGQAVAARHAHMDLYAFNLGILGGMAKSGEFNADLAMGAAKDLAALASMSQASYWIPGTSSEDLEDSRALPVAFTDMEDAMAKSMALTEAANAMVEAAGTLDGVRSSLGAVGGACGACHKAYRAPSS